MRLMPGTGVGKGGVEGYAAYAGIKPADVVAGMTATQTPADVGSGVVALATGKSQVNSFMVNENGLAPVACRARISPALKRKPHDRHAGTSTPARPADPRPADL